MKGFYFRWPPYRFYKVRNFLLFLLILILTMALLQAVVKNIKVKGDQEFDLPSTTVVINGDLAREALQIFGLDTRLYKNILASKLPSAGQAGQGDPDEHLFLHLLQAVLDVEPGNPRSFFGQGLMTFGAIEVLAAAMESQPLFEDEAIVEIPATVPAEAATAAPARLWEQPAAVQGAEVIIINTHNAETYRATDGTSKKEGENAGVAKAAAHLAAILTNEYHIGTDRSETIHDYPKFDDAYGNSAETLEKLLTKNPGARVVIDIHRDAGQNKPLSTVINGQKTAQIRFIVGSDTKLPHPHWTDNREFARRMTEKMDAMYPGLSLGYRVQSGRYNQHLHPRAILIEVGNDHNSLEEARRAMELFAAVLHDLLTTE